MCKNFKEKGICKYGEKCLFAHGEHELSKREPVASPKKELPLEEIDNISVFTKDSPEKLEVSEAKSVSVVSYSQNSEIKEVICEELLVTENDSGMKDRFSLPSNFIYRQLGLDMEPS